jgi:hypothetical protein
MADEIEKRVIIVEVDKTAADASIKAVKALDTETNKLASSTKKLDKALSDSGTATKRVAKENSAVASSVRDVTEALGKQANEAKQGKSAIEAYDAALRSVKGAGADLSGDIAGSLGGLRGATSAVGLGGASPAFDIAESFADIGEFAPKLKVSLEGLGNTLRAGEGAASGFVANAGDAIGGLLGVSGGMGSLLAVALPVGLALGAVTVALSLFNAEQEKQAQLLTATLDAQRSVNEAVATGLTTEDATQRLAEVQRLRDAEIEFRDTQQAGYDSAIAELGILGGLAQQIAPQEQVLADSIAKSSTNIQAYDAEIRALNSQLESGGLTANDMAVAEEELARTREAESQRALQAAEQSAQRVSQLEQQRVDLITNRAIASANAEETASLESKFARQDEKAETQAHYNELKNIAADGFQRIEAINQEIAALPAEQAQALAEVSAKGTKELNKLNGDYFSNQIKATRNFAKESGRIATDTAKAAKRTADDLADNLADAARDNDVVAFLQLQRDGQKELKRNTQDAGEAEKRRAQDFAEQQEEQRQAFEQRRSEVLAGITEEKSKVLQSYAEKRAALETQISQERAATEAALANAKARYQQSEALEAQEAQRNAQRAEIRARQEQAAFDRQIQAINAKTQAELAGLQRVAQAANSLSAGGNKSYTKAGGFSPPVYGGGGFQKAGAGNGGLTINVSNNNSIGDIASTSQVNAALNAQSQQTIGAIIGAWTKAKQG